MKRSCLKVSAEKRNARKADKIRLCGHLRRYEKIIKIYIKFIQIQQFSSNTGFFDADKYSNANACILGMSGAGKTFLMQLIALRLRQQGVQVFIIAPIKGHEFAEVCDRIGGKYIRIAPSSQDCINIMEIRKKTLNTDYEIHGDKRNDSILAEKIQKLMIFFSLIKNDITQNELKSHRRCDCSYI